jgi:hypothetical protein
MFANGLAEPGERASHLILVSILVSLRGDAQPDDPSMLTDGPESDRYVVIRQLCRHVITELPHTHGLQLHHRDHLVVTT